MNRREFFARTVGGAVGIVAAAVGVKTLKPRKLSIREIVDAKMAALQRTVIEACRKHVDEWPENYKQIDGYLVRHTDESAP